MRISPTVLVTAVALVLTVTATPSFAQSWGLKAGYQSATLTDAFSRGSGETSRLPGFVAGIFDEFGGGRVNVQLEVVLSRRGARQGSGADRIDYVIYYTEIPLLLRVNAKRGGDTHVYVVAGPALGSRLRAKTKSTGVTEDISDQIERYDVGIAAGAGLEFQRLVVDGRFTQGLRQVDRTVADKVRNQTVAVTAGILF